MKVKSRDFIPAAQIAINDPDLQTAMRRGTTKAYNGRIEAMFASGYAHGEAMRQQAAEAKRRALRNLPDLLEQAEANMQANGIKVLWAMNAEEANRLVLDIAKRHDARLVAKSKSMVSEELGVNHVLQTHGIEVVETDLGEFIIQLNDEPPSHIVAPVIHKTKEAVRDIFVRELDMPPTDDAGTMTYFAREHLRRVFLKAAMGISGGNFIIAETGSICLVTNEGNGRMVTTLPRVHVALIGIEKIVETVEDYVTLTQVLPRSALGQTMPVYTQIINGPRRDDESDGPEHVYVILVDNGRSDIYGTSYAEALACIRCGACLNACPVYRTTGGHAYGWVYSGPIGAVITPLLNGLYETAPLPYASSLCGSCKQACPVNIDLPRMLLDLRRDIIDQSKGDRMWNLGIRLWARATRSPRLFALGGKMARLGLNTPFRNRLPGPLGAWTKTRDFPPIAPKSFRQLWMERQRQGRKYDDQP